MARTESTMVALGTAAPAFELIDVRSGLAMGRDDVFALSWDDEATDQVNKMPGGGTSKGGRHGLLVMFLCVPLPLRQARRSGTRAHRPGLLQRRSRTDRHRRDPVQ